MKKICVRMPNWIGDLVMATPLLEDLKALYPDSELTAITPEPLDEVLMGSPHVDRVVAFKRTSRFSPVMQTGETFTDWLKGEHFDLGILTTGSFSTAYLFWKGGVKKRVGFFRWSRLPFLTKAVWTPKKVKNIHLVDTYKKLLRPLGQKRSASTLCLSAEKKEKPPKEIWIGINPGAAYGSAKCWLPDRFRKVIKKLVRDVPRAKIFVFGDANTKGLTRDICRNLPPNVVNLADKTTLRELCNYIASLDAFLTNDSGPMHIAAALKTPLVALFGSTNEVATGPYRWGTVIHKHVDCSPCYQRVCPIDFRCMRKVEVGEVVGAVKRLLTEQAEKNLAKPFEFDPLMKTPKIKEVNRERRAAVKEAVVILAGGKGRRLGLTKPKGCLEIGGKSLYQILLEKCRGKKVWILTSSATHDETKEHVRGLGFSPEYAKLRMMQTLNADEDSPEGNGGVFEAVTETESWKKEEGIDVIHVIPIDNPLAGVDDPSMLPLGEEELVVKAIRKRSREESLGTLLEKGGRLYVCEYFENSEGSLGELGYSGMFSCRRSFFEKMAETTLPWHLVRKGQIELLERLVVDAFPLAENWRVVKGRRNREFFPIKSEEDLEEAEKKLWKETYA